MSHQHDDDLGPVGGIGSNNREYGGKRPASNRVQPDTQQQIQAVFDKVKDNTPGMDERPTIDIARRLRRWLAEEDIHISLDEATRIIEQHRQA